LSQLKYIPERKDVIWLDFEPSVENEIGKYRPALVLTSKDFNRSGFLMCCPVSTSIRGGELEVPVKNLDSPSVVVTNIVQTYKWIARKPQFIVQIDDNTYRDVIARLAPFITGKVLE